MAIEKGTCVNFATECSDGQFELRVDHKEVRIYANDEGLRKLIHFCSRLLEKNVDDHIHLEDYNMLTPNSVKGVIARFGAVGSKHRPD